MLSRARRFSAQMAGQELRKLVQRPKRPPTTPETGGNSGRKRSGAPETRPAKRRPDPAMTQLPPAVSNALLGGITVVVTGMAKAWLPQARSRPINSRHTLRIWHDGEWFGDEARRLAKGYGGLKLGARVRQLAQRCGAALADTVPDIAGLKRGIGVLLCDQEEPTPLFAAACAMGFVPLHYSWLLHAIGRSALPDWQPYLAVAEWSPIIPSGRATSARTPAHCPGPSHLDEGPGSPTSSSSSPRLPHLRSVTRRLLSGMRIALCGKAEAIAKLKDIQQVIQAGGGICVTVPFRKEEVDMFGCACVVLEGDLPVTADVPVLHTSNLLQCVIRHQSPLVVPPPAKRPIESSASRKRKREAAFVLRCASPGPRARSKPEDPGDDVDQKPRRITDVLAPGGCVRLMLAGRPRVGRVLRVERPPKASPSSKEKRAAASEANREAASQITVQLYDTVLTAGLTQRELRLSHNVQSVASSCIIGPAFVLPISLDEFLHCTYWCPAEAPTAP